MMKTFLIAIATLTFFSNSIMSQTFCADFHNSDLTFTGGQGVSDEIFYSEADIDFRFKDGYLGPTFSIIRIQELPLWTGIYGSDNFSGSKLQWQEAYSHILFNNLPTGFKTITIDYNSYDEKIILEPIDVWGVGNLTVEFDTVSLVNGGILTITGFVDSIGIGAAIHNDYVIDNVCVEVEPSVGLHEQMDSSHEPLQKINLYPNPTSGVVEIQSDETISCILIFDTFGKLVMEISDGSIYLSNLKSGSYLAKISSDSGVSQHRLIKL